MQYRVYSTYNGSNHHPTLAIAKDLEEALEDKASFEQLFSNVEGLVISIEPMVNEEEQTPKSLIDYLKERLLCEQPEVEGQ